MKSSKSGLGHKIAPPRFILFVVLLIAGGGVGASFLGVRHGLMAGFDVAATIFLLSLFPIFRCDAAGMRKISEQNDANRVLLLAVTGVVVTVILVTVAAELIDRKDGSDGGWAKTLVIATLALAWLFSNTVYALHYAHLYYSHGQHGRDRGGIDFPKTPEPDYGDFIYFAFTLGMTFQTSDSNITSSPMRRVVVAHSFAGFVYNIGVLAFTINVLGG